MVVKRPKWHHVEKLKYNLVKSILWVYIFVFIIRGNGNYNFYCWFLQLQTSNNDVIRYDFVFAESMLCTCVPVIKQKLDNVSDANVRHE